jgi:hypothetical protein
MCDVRRDQVALLLTMLDSLTGKSWIGHCMATLKDRRIDPARMGFLFNPDGSSVNFEPGVVAAYAKDVRDDTVFKPPHACGGVWFRYLSFLAESDGGGVLLEKNWHYDVFNDEIGKALMDLTSSKIPRTPWPDGHGPRASKERFNK